MLTKEQAREEAQQRNSNLKKSAAERLAKNAAWNKANKKAKDAS